MEYLYTNDADGCRIAIDPKTGEILEVINIEVPCGTSIITPAEKRANRERKEREAQRSIIKSANRDMGKFYWLRASETFSDLPPASVPRLLYFVSFCRYDYSLRKDRSKHIIKRSQLEQLMGLSKATTSRFIKSVSPQYIEENNDGFYLKKNTRFFKGKIHWSQENEGEEYFRIHIDSIRKLYLACQPNEHKRIGYIFQLLPYVNKEYNILCKNPMEPDFNKIVPIRVQELCNLIGYSFANVNRLLDTLKNAHFTIDNKQQAFVSIVYDDSNQISERIIVNPRILYRGSDYRKVESFASFQINMPRAR